MHCSMFQLKLADMLTSNNAPVLKSNHESISEIADDKKTAADIAVNSNGVKHKLAVEIENLESEKPAKILKQN